METAMTVQDLKCPYCSHYMTSMTTRFERFRFGVRIFYCPYCNHKAAITDNSAAKIRFRAIRKESVKEYYNEH